MQIEPSAADVDRLTAAGVQFTWRVTEELVRRELGEPERPAESPASAAGAGESPEWLSFIQRITDAKEKAEERLFEQLRVKDEQIAAKDTQIAELAARLRESNILMQALQKQLPEPTPAAAVTTASPSSVKRREKAKPTAAFAAKRNWWAKLLR